MGRFLFILILSSFFLELYSLPLQQESLPSAFMQRKTSQEQRYTHQQIISSNSIENAIRHSRKFQHYNVIIHKSSGGGSSSRSGSSSSSRPSSSGGSPKSSGGSKTTNSGGTTKTNGGGFRTPSTPVIPSNPVYVAGNTNNHNSYHSGAENRNPIGLSALVVAAMASLLHFYVAFGRR